MRIEVGTGNTFEATLALALIAELNQPIWDLVEVQRLGASLAQKGVETVVYVGTPLLNWSPEKLVEGYATHEYQYRLGKITFTK